MDVCTENWKKENTPDMIFVKTSWVWVSCGSNQLTKWLIKNMYVIFFYLADKIQAIWLKKNKIDGKNYHHTTEN